MPGLDLGHLSSNWKKLQTQLQSEKKANPPSNGLKRKHAADKSSKPSNGYKRGPRLTGDNTTTLGPKRRKMGSSMSSQQPENQAQTSHSTLTRDHDIPASDLSAAYGNTSRPRTKSFHDEVNGGLHPTHKAGKYLALDCEMVGTGPPPHLDDVLARVSLVNFHGEQIYDSYVLPSPGVQVNDYRTFVSGITPSHIKPGSGARPFAEVQKTVADLLQDRVLVGHALKKDLQVLMLSHAMRDVRDTSRYAKFRVESRGKPPALRNLAKSELGLIIQTGEHSSVEDARATMALFRKEKSGFEEENRRVFGQRRVLGKGEKGKKSSAAAEEEDEGDEEEEDLDTLDGEEDLEGSDEEGAQRSTAPKAKKKRKKKKRTKRN